MVELLFLTSPSDNDISSTYFQVQDSGSEILKFLIITKYKNNIITVSNSPSPSSVYIRKTFSID